MLENYASIVEKTNNQLGLGVNLSTWAVTILSFLIAVIAIAVGWYLWKNSKEQKDLFELTLSQYKKIFEDQAKLFLEGKKIEIDKVLTSLEELKNTTKETTKEKTEELDKLIVKYKKQKEDLSSKIIQASTSNNNVVLTNKQGYNFLDPSISVFSTPTTVSSLSNLYTATPTIALTNICSKCGHYNNLNLTTSLNFCSYCGNKL